MKRHDWFCRFTTASTLVALLTLGLATAAAQGGTSVLFIGNSFTFGAGSPVQFYRSSTVTDLNDEGIGGVPALFKSFTVQAGLDYTVSLETRGGSGFEFHLENKQEVLGSRRVGQGRDAGAEHAGSRRSQAMPPRSSRRAASWRSSCAAAIRRSTFF